mgnify:CR=1 FL=1
MALVSTPAERRQLVQQLPELRADDSMRIQRFLDAIWAENGLARATLDSYRRDLEGLARWMDGRDGGLAGIERPGDFIGLTSNVNLVETQNAGQDRAGLAKMLSDNERVGTPVA